MKLIQYAVVFEPFEDRRFRVCEATVVLCGMIRVLSKYLTHQEEAQKEADKWNTGQVVQYG